MPKAHDTKSLGIRGRRPQKAELLETDQMYTQKAERFSYRDLHPEMYKDEKPSRITNYSRIGIAPVLEWLRANGPATATQMAEGVGLSRGAIHLHLTNSPDRFEAVGIANTPGQPTLWKVAS